MTRIISFATAAFLFTALAGAPSFAAGGGGTDSAGGGTDSAGAGASGSEIDGSAGGIGRNPAGVLNGGKPVAAPHRKCARFENPALHADCVI